MSARSPFAIATAAAEATPAPTPGFAAQLYVDGIAHAGNTDYVAIKSRDPDNKQPLIFLEVGKTNPDGLKVERVSWSKELGKSTVDVSKAGEKATLEFDEQSLKGVAAAAAPPGPPACPSQTCRTPECQCPEGRRISQCQTASRHTTVSTRSSPASQGPLG